MATVWSGRSERYSSATTRIRSLIDETAYTQPALFAVQAGLVALWRSWGIVPDAVLGHSVGEFAAAYCAGVYTLEQALELVAERARLMQGLPRSGVMAAVFSDEATVAAEIEQMQPGGRCDRCAERSSQHGGLGRAGRSRGSRRAF